MINIILYFLIPLVFFYIVLYDSISEKIAEKYKIIFTILNCIFLTMILFLGVYVFFIIGLNIR